MYCDSANRGTPQSIEVRLNRGAPQPIEGCTESRPTCGSNYETEGAEKQIYCALDKQADETQQPGLAIRGPMCGQGRVTPWPKLSRLVDVTTAVAHA